MKQYWNPLYLPTLRYCNIRYQTALHHFKHKEWKEALNKYKEFLEYNECDMDSYAEAAVCYFHIAKQKRKEDDGAYKQDYKKSLSYLNKAVKQRPSSKRYSEFLADVKKLKKQLGGT